MARREVNLALGVATISDDDPLRPESALSAILSMRVIDELTLATPRTRIQIRCALPGVAQRSAEGGYCGLVGRPRDVAHAFTTPGALQATLEADGYLPRDLLPEIELARRTLASPAAAGDMLVDVVPPDTVPALQFRAGRGVVIERIAPKSIEEFTRVPLPAVPLPPGKVTMTDGLDEPHPVGAHLSGIPMMLPPQALHRATSVRIRGRLRQRTGPTTVVPAPMAEIGIVGVWWAYPHALSQPPVAADLCALRPGLRFAHPVGAPIQRCSLATIAPSLTLRETASPGARTVVVAPAGGLNPAGGDVLRLGDPLGGEDECVVTEGFDAPLTADASMRIRLTAPIASLHRANEPVWRVAVSGMVNAGTISREALPGDSVLFAAGVGAQPTHCVLTVEHGTPRAAYYHATQYPAWDGANFSHQAPLDAQGAFEWPPLARVAQVRVVARLGALQRQLDIPLDHGDDNQIAIDFS